MEFFILFLSVIITFIILTLFILPWIFPIIYLVYSNKFKKNSYIYKKIIDLNNKGLVYANTRKIIYICDNVNSLKNINKIDPDTRIYLAIKSNENLLKSELKKIFMNRHNYTKYKKLFNELLDELTYNESNLKFINSFITYFQRFISKRSLIKPKMNIIVFYNATYISPKARNKYNKTKKYYYNDLVNLTSYYKDLERLEIIKKESVAIERAKMSDSLRYNVLKRDNFRCQICGATQADGVKLHVDHIIPVSKGGKTHLTNLQTLCERCNIGKSNKI